MKGVFNDRPVLPRYTAIWDVSIVLNYIKALAPVDDLSLKLLTKKLVMLMALLSAQRVQSLYLLDIASMVKTDDRAVFSISAAVKQTRPGFHMKPMEFTSFPHDKDLCVIDVLGKYLARTAGIRGGCSYLFISFQKPHRHASTDTLSRWLKSVLRSAGIDTTMFKGHSTRAASVSAADRAGVPIHDILAAAGWSSSGTFDKFYNKSVSQTGQFSRAIMSSTCTNVD
ncbi:MAG: tyrosine-type recombinase/integrase [Sedimenticola sp.]